MSTRTLVGRSMMSSRNRAGRSEDRVTATLIPGDGVGTELMSSVEEVLKAAAVTMDFEDYFMSKVHSALSHRIKSVVNSNTRNGLCLKGILTTPSFTGSGAAGMLNIRMRNTFDLYANVLKVYATVLKVASIPWVKFLDSNVDLVVVGEQTEYSCLEHASVPWPGRCLRKLYQDLTRRFMTGHG